MGKKIGRNEPCPCGSNKKYKLCCYGKNINFDIDDSGDTNISIPLSNKIQKDLTKHLRETIRTHFEREPQDDDPIFVAKYMHSEEDQIRILTDAMKEAKADPAHIYAVKKTGYIITDTNKDKVPGIRLHEWEAAVKEYLEHGEDPNKDSIGNEFEAILESLKDEILSLIFLFGISTDKFFNKIIVHLKPNAGNILTPSQYQASCIVRTHVTLRSIRTLIDEHLSDDVLKLTRSIYDNYLHLVYTIEHPERIPDLVDSLVGLRNGTHQYKKTDTGKQDKRVIINPTTGAEYLGHISAYTMAESSKISSDIEFFDFFYKRTSEFLHPSVFTLLGFLSEEGLDPVKPHVYEEGVMFSVLVSAMIASQISFIYGCPENIKQDVATVVSRIKNKLIKLFDLIDIWRKVIGADMEDINILKQRCNHL